MEGEAPERDTTVSLRHSLRVPGLIPVLTYNEPSITGNADDVMLGTSEPPMEARLLVLEAALVLPMEGAPVVPGMTRTALR